MKKSQFFEDLSRFWIVRNNRPLEVMVLYKRGAQYCLLAVGHKYTFHSTENLLSKMKKEGEIYNSPLAKAMRED